MGAAALVDFAMHLSAEEGAVRVISEVVSGIGFFGAGVSTAIDPNWMRWRPALRRIVLVTERNHTFP